MSTELTNIQEQDYNEILLQAVAVIESSRSQIARKLNESVSNAYWNIGKLLYDRKLEGKHGDSVVKRLSYDLKTRFPYIGLSPRQLWNMKKFYVRYSNADPKLLQSVAVLPWSHNLLLLNKNVDDGATMFYAHEVVAKHWNRDLLLNAINLNMQEK